MKYNYCANSLFLNASTQKYINEIVDIYSGLIVDFFRDSTYAKTVLYGGSLGRLEPAAKNTLGKFIGLQSDLDIYLIADTNDKTIANDLRQYLLDNYHGTFSGVNDISVIQIPTSVIRNFNPLFYSGMSAASALAGAKFPVINEIEISNLPPIKIIFTDVFRPLNSALTNYLIGHHLTSIGKHIIKSTEYKLYLLLKVLKYIVFISSMHDGANFSFKTISEIYKKNAIIKSFIPWNEREFVENMENFETTSQIPKLDLSGLLEALVYSLANSAQDASLQFAMNKLQAEKINSINNEVLFEMILFCLNMFMIGGNKNYLGIADCYYQQLDAKVVESQSLLNTLSVVKTAYNLSEEKIFELLIELDTYIKYYNVRNLI